MSIQKQLVNEMKEPKEVLEETLANNTYVKRYPNYFRRNDIQDDFVAVSRFIRMMLPEAKVVQQEVGSLISTIRFDVAQSKEPMLERLLAKHGYVKYKKAK